jgi:hypothetical protein
MLQLVAHGVESHITAGGDLYSTVTSLDVIRGATFAEALQMQHPTMDVRGRFGGELCRGAADTSLSGLLVLNSLCVVCADAEVLII